MPEKTKKEKKIEQMQSGSEYVNVEHFCFCIYLAYQNVFAGLISAALCHQ